MRSIQLNTNLISVMNVRRWRTQLGVVPTLFVSKFGGRYYWQQDIGQYYNYVIMSAMASQITSLTIVYPSVLFRRRSKKTSALRVTGQCEGNSPVTGEYPTQRASNAENVSIWWGHHDSSRDDTMHHGFWVYYSVSINENNEALEQTWYLKVCTMTHVCISDLGHQWFWMKAFRILLWAVFRHEIELFFGRMLRQLSEYQ